MTETCIQCYQTAAYTKYIVNIWVDIDLWYEDVAAVRPKFPYDIIDIISILVHFAAMGKNEIRIVYILHKVIYQLGPHVRCQDILPMSNGINIYYYDLFCGVKIFRCCILIHAVEPLFKYHERPNRLFHAKPYLRQVFAVNIKAQHPQNPHVSLPDTGLLHHFPGHYDFSQIFYACHPVNITFPVLIVRSL